MRPVPLVGRGLSGFADEASERAARGLGSSGPNVRYAPGADGAFPSDRQLPRASRRTKVDGLALDSGCQVAKELDAMAAPGAGAVKAEEDSSRLHSSSVTSTEFRRIRR